jgi:hypothetical protein
MDRCPRCTTAIPAKNTRCPYCGWSAPAAPPDNHGDALTNPVSGAHGYRDLWTLVIHPGSLLVLLLLLLPAHDIWAVDPRLNPWFPVLALLIAAFYIGQLRELNDTYRLAPPGRAITACIISGCFPFVLVVIPATGAAMYCSERITQSLLIAQLYGAVAYFLLALLLRHVLWRTHLADIGPAPAPAPPPARKPPPAPAPPPASVADPHWADAALRDLTAGRPASLRQRGHAMSGLIEDGQLVRLEPITGPLRQGDIVLALIGGEMVIHAITNLQGYRIELGTYHRVIGWTPRTRVYGRAVGVTP